MSAPLASWHFSGTLRTYQAEVLTQVPIGDESLHIVAPPGSGKTLLGLLLAARVGHRALVLAPTTTIREQWVRTARDLAPEEHAVSDTVSAIADVTVLTYQLLSVTGDGSPFEELARTIWIDELVQAGRTEQAASTWLAELAVDNDAQYRSGLRSRVRRLRRRFSQQRPDELARVLHPNAIAAMDALVEAGVQTIVLDECHHLLDHWALVVAYLRARIRERGGAGIVIGLTATLPSPDDETEFENYSQLLGPVDYEVPTPAVVKEGHLAPYRDQIFFTEPTPAEARFLRHHESLLGDLLRQVLSSADGLDYLSAQLQPELPESEDFSDEKNQLSRFEKALSDDFPFARSCAAVLREVAPSHPLLTLVPEVLLERASTEDALTVIARFAQTRLLQDRAARKQWEYVKGALADFGYLLTDRGIRRGRNPVETTLAYSASKDDAAVRILHQELSGEDGERIRAVIVTDFVRHGNHRGDIGDDAAGATRAFRRLLADSVTAALRPVLLTAQQLRVPSADAPQLSAVLADVLASPVETFDDDGTSCALRVPVSGQVVAAVSELIRRGEVRVLVGTRGLLGEGWDCPAVNTLIDLTSVATSSATQQLRGRTLRLDPEWPEKVAHNWSVACLIPANMDLDDAAEPQRLRRKHSHLWGLDAEGTGAIVSGLRHALPRAALDAFEAVLAKDAAVSVAQINVSPAARAQTRAEWRIGEPYTSRAREVVAVRRRAHAPLLRAAPPGGGGGAVTAFFGGALGAGTLAGMVDAAGLAAVSPGVGLGTAAVGGAVAVVATLLPSLGRMLRDRSHPAAVYQAATLAVARTLHEAGRVQTVDESALVARVDPQDRSHIRIELGGPAAERTVLADAVAELFGAVENPRFLLQIDRGSRGLSRLADRLSPGRAFLAVPRLIARRRGDAERFAMHWKELVGPCRLHELQGAEGLALLRVARSVGTHLDDAEPRAQIWG